MPLSSMHIIIIIIIIIVITIYKAVSVFHNILYCMSLQAQMLYINFIRHGHFSGKVRYMHVFLKFKA